MKDSSKKYEEYKYLTICLPIGLVLGACAGIITCIFLNKSFGLGIGIGAGLGMLLGITIGTAMDYEMKNKKK